MLYESFSFNGMEGLKKCIEEHTVDLISLNDAMKAKYNQSLLYAEDYKADDYVKALMSLGVAPTEMDLASAYFFAYGSYELATAMWKMNPNLDINKVFFSMDMDSPQQMLAMWLDDGRNDTSPMFQHMMKHGALNLNALVWIPTEQKKCRLADWIHAVDVENHPNGKNILKIREMM